MEALDYWRLHKELTVFQAVLLALGKDPTALDEWELEQRLPGYGPLLGALCKALQSREVEGSVEIVSDRVNIHKSLVQVASFKVWLAANSVASTFFFPNGPSELGFMQRGAPRYAPKLAAAYLVWQALADESLTQKKSPKQAIKEWLNEHAGEFGLLDDDGTLNKEGVDQIARVVNWASSGGAPRSGKST